MKWTKSAAIVCVCMLAIVAVTLVADPTLRSFALTRLAPPLVPIVAVCLYVVYVVRSSPGRSPGHSQSRRVLKWMMTITGIVLLIATLGSARWQVRWVNPASTWSIDLAGGNLTVQWAEPAPRSWFTNLTGRPRWEVRENDHNMLLWPVFRRFTNPIVGSLSRIEVPLGIPLLLCVFTIILLVQLDRRHRPPGHCQNCGYDLTGNVSGRCPECGTAVGDEKASDTSG
jgi:hypothetical protein